MKAWLKKFSSVQTPEVKRWNYTILPMLADSDKVNVDPTQYLEIMNGLGDTGYELVCVYNNCLVFKKPC
jgi:hypothetical protein